MTQPESTTTTTTTTQPEGTSQDTVEHICWTPDCGKPAAMQCPTCVKYNGTPSYFCSQECFKTNWKRHAPIHTEMKKIFEFVPPQFKYTGTMRPAYVSQQQLVLDDDIPRPDYWMTGTPTSELVAKAQNVAPIYTPEEIDGIRKACQMGRAALDHVAPMVKPGVTPDAIDKAIHKYIIDMKAYPSPLNYRNFPKSVCISINEVICHGIPDFRPLQDGDIVNIDVTVYYKGFHGDLNETYTCGNVDFESKRLIKASYDSLFDAIQLVKPGTLFRDFGDAISKSIKKHGFSSVRAYCGHGIGHLFHCAPNIPHYSNNKAVGTCKPGMIFSIEPMINAGDYLVDHWPDDWTATTVDGKRSAQFEHTCLVTEDGCEILTARTSGSTPLWWESQDEQDQKDLIAYNEYCANPPQHKTATTSSISSITTPLPGNLLGGKKGGKKK